MNLVGDLEFYTIIDDKPAIIKIPNARLHDINVLLENGYRKVTCMVTAIENIEEEH